MAADDGLLGVALAAVRQLFAVAVRAARPCARRCARRSARRAPRRVPRPAPRRLVLVLLLVGDQRGVERLRQLRAVAVERVGLERQLPRQHVGALAVLDRRVVRHVDGLGDRARDEGLRRRHHADVAFDREVALAEPAAGAGAVEHRQVLGLQMRRAFERHRAADMRCWRRSMSLLREAERGQQIEAAGRRAARRVKLQHVAAELLAERPLVEGELDVEGGGEARLDLGDLRRRRSPWPSASSWLMPGAPFSVPRPTA